MDIKNIKLSSVIDDEQVNVIIDNLDEHNYRINHLENDIIARSNDYVLRHEFEHHLEIMHDFQQNTTEYLHYLENRINKLTEIKPILIIGNRKEANDESNIP
jgi:hypothetical protein